MKLRVEHNNPYDRCAIKVMMLNLRDIPVNLYKEDTGRGEATLLYNNETNP